MTDFPRQQCRGLIEAAARKKTECRISRTFPGSNAGASLKLGEAPKNTKTLLDFPRQQCRGLIEARNCRRSDFFTVDTFPGSNAGASLKQRRRK